MRRKDRVKTCWNEYEKETHLSDTPLVKTGSYDIILNGLMLRGDLLEAFALTYGDTEIQRLRNKC